MRDSSSSSIDAQTAEGASEGSSSTPWGTFLLIGGGVFVVGITTAVASVALAMRLVHSQQRHFDDKAKREREERVRTRRGNKEERGGSNSWASRRNRNNLTSTKTTRYDRGNTTTNGSRMQESLYAETSQRSSSAKIGAPSNVQSEVLDYIANREGVNKDVLMKVASSSQLHQPRDSETAESEPELQEEVASAGDRRPRLTSPKVGGIEFDRIMTPEHVFSEEEKNVCKLLKEAMALRDKWLYDPPLLSFDEEEVPVSSMIPGFNPFEWQDEVETSSYDIQMVSGLVHVIDKSSGKAPTRIFMPPGTADEFCKDMYRVLSIATSGPVKTFTQGRLVLIEQKYNLHCMMNHNREKMAQKLVPHRDFYNCRKVDTHVHHSSCMNAKHLLRFIKKKLRVEPEEVVIFRDGKYLTMREVFESLKLTIYDLNIDTLDMHADKNTFHRFDRFNLKYNPCGQSRLREILIKQDNIIQGRYLAEVTKEVFDDLEESKYTLAEYRISIYGRKPSEWDTLAAWITNNKLYSDNVKWLIQLPRLFDIYKKQGTLKNFHEMLENVFMPLFEVTQDPASHPQLHMFLKNVVGMDMVDDESKSETRMTTPMTLPEEWDEAVNPPYSYYVYYVSANLYSLNCFRASRGLNVIHFRPHCGEAGDMDHLASSFMAAHNIAHGINLRKSPGLQYLYYLTQIGLAMSPLSNNQLFLDYNRNPFPQYFARGLNVSLSTDDPLQIHLTKEPLVEEYSIAGQVWKLTSCDMCEIARNSVIQSGFEHKVKKHWLGTRYWLPGIEGNDITKTNVPDIRLSFRHELHMGELEIIRFGSSTENFAGPGPPKSPATVRL